MTSQTRPIVYDQAAITAGDITAEDTNVTGAHWARLLRHGMGVASGFDLTLSTTADTGTLSVGWGVWQGFELDLFAAEVLSLPPVATPTTYVIGVLYNPANFSTEQGCLSIIAGVKGSITVPSGGQLWTLYEVDRTQTQSLAASTVRNFKAMRSCVIYVANSLPPAVEYPLGTLALSPTAIYRRTSVSSQAAWVPVLADTGDVTTGFTNQAGWTNPGSGYRIQNGILTAHLRADRTGGTITATSAGSIVDSPMLAIPTPARSSWSIVGRGRYTLPDNSSWGFDWTIGAGGLWTLTSANPNVQIPNGTRMYATATYIL